MNEQDQKIFDDVVNVVSVAVTAAAPLAGPGAPEVLAVVAAVRGLISFGEQLGHGDPIREALAAELAVGRKLTDEALKLKHANDPK